MTDPASGDSLDRLAAGIDNIVAMAAIGVTLVLVLALAGLVTSWISHRGSRS